MPATLNLDLVRAARRLGTAMAIALDALDPETYEITQNVALAIADRDHDGTLTAEGCNDVAAALEAKVRAERPLPRLSALEMSERAGITFSMLAPDGTEVGVTTFAEMDGAIRTVRHTAQLAHVGLVPRTPSAVDAMAEALS